MRLLDSCRLDDNILEMPSLAVMRKAALARPSLTEKIHRFVVTFARFLDRDAEAVELAPPVALSDAKIEASIGEQVQRCADRGLRSPPRGSTTSTRPAPPTSGASHEPGGLSADWLPKYQETAPYRRGQDHPSRRPSPQSTPSSQSGECNRGQ